MRVIYLRMPRKAPRGRPNLDWRNISELPLPTVGHAGIADQARSQVFMESADGLPIEAERGGSVPLPPSEIVALEPVGWLDWSRD